MEKKPNGKMRRTVNSNVAHFATSSRNCKPNVVPIGAIKAVSNEKILIADVLLNKTKKNLKDNPQVAIAVEDLSSDPPRGYQIKGSAEIFEGGKYFEKARNLLEEKARKRGAEEKLEIKSAVLVKVTEVYSTTLSER